ncbi:hypothetical protein DDZ16_20215 [Marinilabilia rubra]|uniref:Uncharacterized protein n=1 Tax=Marinilabilia rubra TaxID=2162893 RepID=A0A2U2B3A6_9BACT|nr:hypothetical protein DDZ16_20215 [Marinilabilia rubra]
MNLQGCESVSFRSLNGRNMFNNKFFVIKAAEQSVISAVKTRRIANPPEGKIKKHGPKCNG